MVIWKEKLLKLKIVSIFLISFSITFFSEESIEEKLKRLSGEVAEIAKKEMGIKDKISLLKKRVSLSRSTLEKLKKDKENLKNQLDKLNEEIEEIKKEEEEVLKYFKARLKLNYLTGFIAEYRLLFSVESTSDLLEINYLLSSLNLRDKAKVERIKELKETKRNKEIQINEDLRKIEEIEKEELQQQRQLLMEVEEKNRYLEELSKNGNLARRNLSEAIENAKKMDQYFKDLNFKSKVELYSNDINLYRGKLEMPVKGEIVQGFGDYIHPKFKTKLPHPGVDISSPLGTPVHSIFDGEVVFSDWLSGYGFTVILRHPGNLYSMYSHLDRLDVKNGDVVKRGKVIGTAGGDPTKNYSGIYFELREGKMAVDPEKWFKE